MLVCFVLTYLWNHLKEEMDLNRTQLEVRYIHYSLGLSIARKSLISLALLIPADIPSLVNYCNCY